MSTDRLSAAGSYTFGQFEKNAEELKRLKMQATIALDIEKAVWSKAGLTSDMRVLDLACGPGFISCELARLVNKGDVTGVDISAELIATAHQAKASEKIENVMFQTGNLYELELPANRFDFVYARFVFQHLAKPQLALENILRVLKPGGSFLFVDSLQTGDVPEYDGLLSIFPQLFHEPYYTSYLKEDLTGLCKNAGLDERWMQPAFVSRAAAFVKTS